MDYLIFRMSSSLLAGMIISQTGTLIQLTTKNILASPSTLGFDGLSILWVLIFHSILLWLNVETPSYILIIGIPLFILLGIFFSSVLTKASRAIQKLILMGLTFNLLVGAIFSLWQFLFLAFNLPFPVELWFGHFRFASFETFVILLFVQLAIFAGWRFYKSDLTLLSLGSSVANNFKVPTTYIHRFIFISVSVGTFIVVSIFGAFSFLGLIFPIVSRRFWFNRFDLMGEFLLGSLVNGIIFCLIDLVCYLFPFYGAEIPMGLISMIIGAVSLMLILWKSRNRFEILAKR
jgi:ABC-type Fe3+-siderophore transport system permease subunit